MGVKDKLFEASSPIRHATELVNMIREEQSGKATSTDVPYIVWEL